MGNLKASANFAKRILLKHGLEVPFDIEGLIKEYADLEYKEFPHEVGNFDGVTLDLKKPGTRPKVYINSRQPDTRRKFTLAHELGHIIIPWHTGNIIDNISPNIKEHTSYAIYEMEADEFASELLLPTDWIQPLVEHLNNIDSLGKTIEHIHSMTGLSHQAIGYKVIQYLNPGFVFVVTDEDGYIKWSKSSTATSNKLSYHDKGEYLPATKFYENFKSEEYYIQVNGLAYSWFYTASPISIEYDANETKNDKELIKEIVADLGLNPRHHIASISSALAFSRERLKSSNTLNLDNLYRACLEKVNNEPKYQWITKHPKYKTYIYKRALKLIE